MITEDQQLEQTGTKPTEFKIILDPDPQDYFCISDKNLGDTAGKLTKGSVWRLAGRDYAYDEQINYYVFRRCDREAV